MFSVVVGLELVLLAGSGLVCFGDEDTGLLGRAFLGLAEAIVLSDVGELECSVAIALPLPLSLVLTIPLRYPSGAMTISPSCSLGRPETLLEPWFLTHEAIIRH